jgi:hypothetical protein
VLEQGLQRSDGSQSMYLIRYITTDDVGHKPLGLQTISSTAGQVLLHACVVDPATWPVQLYMGSNSMMYTGMRRLRNNRPQPVGLGPRPRVVIPDEGKGRDGDGEGVCSAASWCLLKPEN